MSNNLKEFISEALCQPSDYVTYFASAKLAEMYPGAAIIENESWAFNLPEYAEAGLCSVWRHESVHCQSKAHWRGVEEELEPEIENGWFGVLWTDRGKDYFIDVVYLTWSDAGCETTRRWIIAESNEVAENFLRAVCAYCDEVHGEILVYQDGSWTKDDKLFTSIKSATFENLILPPQLKRELREDFRRFFASREVYRKFGIPWKRGVLLIGPPGNGKTHAIKALVNELGLPCLYVKSFKAERATEQCNMRNVFARARRNAPCLVALEDLDALIEDENRAFLLNELDGFADNEGVVVIASTNHPEKLDPAILDRPSRFDRKYHFGLPGLPERLAYVNYWNQKLQLELRLTEAEEVAVAECTDRFSYAYLKELFLSAMMEWIGNQGSGQVSGSMGETLLERASLLREQLSKGEEAPPNDRMDVAIAAAPLH
ncbi:MAG TPA: ATP-binding protein [Blastocatellia bacterium]|nr:ATP-binding protein [Blastocatellia bacterium]